MLKEYIWAVFIFLGVFSLIFTIVNKRTIKKHIKYQLLSTDSKYHNDGKKNKSEILKPTIELIKPRIVKKLPKYININLKNKANMSGTTMSLENILVLKISLSLITLFLALILIPKSINVVIKILLFVFVAISSYNLPDLVLKRKANIRQKIMRKDFPNFVDYLIICVDAGIGIDLAIYKITNKVKGPLSEEIKKAVVEINYGKSKGEAYKDLANRINLPEVRKFFTSLTSGEQMGISISQILKVQAEEMRREKKQRIQEQGYKIPVKLVFPLVLFLLPELFIIVLGPGIIEIFNRF